MAEDLVPEMCDSDVRRVRVSAGLRLEVTDGEKDEACDFFVLGAAGGVGVKGVEDGEDNCSYSCDSLMLEEVEEK